MPAFERAFRMMRAECGHGKRRFRSAICLTKADSQRVRIVSVRLIGITELLVMFVVAIVLFGGREKFVKTVQEALSDFRGGGPGSPSHPIPADDSKILNRHRQPEHSENDQI